LIYSYLDIGNVIVFSQKRKGGSLWLISIALIVAVMGWSLLFMEIINRKHCDVPVSVAHDVNDIKKIFLQDFLKKKLCLL
jgi:hypothetical protein